LRLRTVQKSRRQFSSLVPAGAGPAQPRSSAQLMSMPDPMSDGLNTTVMLPPYQPLACVW